MNVQLFRIDDRLIHGQVVIAWAKPLNSKFILLCDDDISQNEWERDLYLSSVPEDIQALVCNVKQTSEYLSNSNIEIEKSIVLVKSPAIVVQLLKHGYKPDQVNVGGLHFMDSRKKYLPYLYLGLTEIEEFRYLMQNNISLYCQDVPSAKKIPLGELIGYA